MLKRISKGVFALILCAASSSFADVSDTREVLSHFCESNPKVLEVYDRVSANWVEYGSQVGGHWDLERLLKAVEYSAEKHLGQVRKDAEKTPYIIHPIGVSELLWDLGNIRSVNVLTASLLHDTLEDTDATEEEINELFGERVLYTVQEVTNDPSLSSGENKQRQVDHAPSMSLDGQLVKLADRLYNVRDLDPPPPSWSDEKVDEYYGWGEKLLSALRGTNEGLENALQRRIEDHKNGCSQLEDVLHTVKGTYFEWDPYEGNHIDEYIFILDDESSWTINWSVYERNHISLNVNDEVVISFLEEDQYVMIIPSRDGSLEKRVSFQKIGPNSYYSNFK